MPWTNEYILVFAEMNPGSSNTKIEQRLGIKLNEDLKGMIYDLRFNRMSVLEILAKFEKESIREEENIFNFIQKKKIQHPTLGSVNFSLYDYQKVLLNTFEKNDEIYICKSRQMGMTTLSIAYAFYLAQTTPNYSVFFHSCNYRYSKYPKKILDSMIDVPTPINNKQSVALSNGSYIKFGSTITDIISESFNMMIFDEVAFSKNISREWVMYMSNFKANFKLIIQSTPNGKNNNWFHNTWKKIQNRRLKPLGSRRIAMRQVTWADNRNRDQAWRRSQDGLLGKEFAKQECDAQFI